MQLARPLALALAGASLTTLGLSAAVVDAQAATHKTRVHATIKLSGDHDSLHGRISSPKASCDKGVRVKLSWKSPTSKSFVVVRKTKTTRTGAWVVTKPHAASAIPAGRYFVTVGASRQCAAAKSATIRVG